MSGRKNSLAPYHAIASGSMAGDLDSPITDISGIDNVAIQLSWTGTPTGTFLIQASLDKVNWITLSLNPNPQASGSAGNTLLDLNQLSFPYIKTSYSRTSGSGTLDMWISGKMV